ncbi:hypothetical protein [Fulvivirga lutea]|uniref:Uncharacterized protein n=1 Tax=Fulvivirga lutea TaxID=2810512 RepID=A0A975A0I2_9BACT|nr:hypothetical protein [Fulvivirga lutea]QSE96447.1 hypothetical protein JR347_12645 [Fulvivirga lutea]
MGQEFLENKFVAGDIVFAKEAPQLKLVVRRYIDRVYYCKRVEDPEKKDLVYFERELVDNGIKKM